MAIFTIITSPTMRTRFILFAIAMIAAMPSFAQQELNMPIIQTKYTADPAPLVYKDTVFL